MTLLVRQNAYIAWQDGDITTSEALKALVQDYEELDASYRDFEKMREQTRAQLSELVDRLGGRAEVRGFGVLAITEPSVVAGYDSKALDGLINSIADDQPHLAAQIASCRKRTMRSGDR